MGWITGLIPDAAPGGGQGAHRALPARGDRSPLVAFASLRGLRLGPITGPHSLSPQDPAPRGGRGPAASIGAPVPTLAAPKPAGVCAATAPPRGFTAVLRPGFHADVHTPRETWTCAHVPSRLGTTAQGSVPGE